MNEQVDTSSIGGESARFISTGAGCHRVFDHAFAAGVMNKKRQGSSPHDSSLGSLRLHGSSLVAPSPPISLTRMSLNLRKKSQVRLMSNTPERGSPKMSRSPSLPTMDTVSNNR